MPDAAFADPRLAEIYDPLDPDRRDLDVYAAMAVHELGARSVLDVGCGTGTLACLLAGRGIDAFGVDPAAASLAVARTQPHAELVRWIEGDATVLPPLQADLATMTGNVAQVLLTDADWTTTLTSVRSALRPGGWLVFETRDPGSRAWLGWTREQTHARTWIPGAGTVETWCDVTDVADALVSFRWIYVFESDGAVLTSASTLRFRTRGELDASLRSAGYVVEEVRQAPDRPGRELVFVVRRAD